MGLQFYNSLSRKKEPFIPIVEGKVGLYTCGPTVYDYAHIGNFRTFVFEDLLKRWLQHVGYEVSHIMNITDVDDKTIKKANLEGVDLSAITNRYTSCFMKDVEWLKILPADDYPRATDFIDTIISMISKLLEQNIAYQEKDGSVYFNIRLFPEYGKLSNINIPKQKIGARVADDEYDKDSPNDFVLWKAWKEVDGDIFWESPWGKGRPGWHIECSAMSHDTLGDHFDIHCGGVDNIFPHHENEIAQSKCITGKGFVNYWLHSEFLLVGGGKMSKSLGNYYRISDLIKLGLTPESVRYQLLSGHYRTKISFSLDKKYEADKILERINDFHNILKGLGANNSSSNSYPEAYELFKRYMNDDLDTPRSLAVFFDWMKSTNKKIKLDSIKKQELREAWNFLLAFDSIFGFLRKRKLVIPDKIQALLDARHEARMIKDWVSSDIIRDNLFKNGWSVEDTVKGQKVKKC